MTVDLADVEAGGNELVLRCLRCEPPEQKVEALVKLTAEQWNALVDAAARYRLGPQVYSTIKPYLAQLAVSEDLREKLKNIYFQSAVRNMRLYAQVLKCCSIFNQEGLEVILLKGAHLAEFIYGTPALRPMSDVDVLARKQDLASIDRILRSMGYKTSDESAGCALEHLAPYHKKNAVAIEVHFHITSPPFSELFNPNELWERAGKEVLNGVELLTLGPEDLLLHLCVHTCIHHGFDNGLLPYVDICRVVGHYEKELDWNAFLFRSRQWGIERCVFLMLALAEKMLGAAIPEAIRKEIFALDPESKTALMLAEELIFERGPSVSSGIARLFEKGWRSKLKNFRKRAFPAQEAMGPANPDTDSLSRLDLLGRYRSRLAGVWQRHGKTVWFALKRDPQTLEAIKLSSRRNTLSDWLKKTK